MKKNETSSKQNLFGKKQPKTKFEVRMNELSEKLLQVAIQSGL